MIFERNTERRGCQNLTTPWLVQDQARRSRRSILLRRQIDYYHLGNLNAASPHTHLRHA